MSTTLQSSLNANAETSYLNFKPTPLLWTALWFGTGILFFSLIDITFIVAVIISLLYIVSAVFFKSFFRRFLFLLYSVFFFWGIFYSQELLHLKNNLEKTFLSDAVNIRARVISEPVRTKSGFTHMTVKIDKIDNRDIKIKTSCSCLSLPSYLEPGFVIEGIGVIERNDSRLFLSRGLYGELDLKFIKKITPQKNFYTYLFRLRKFIRKTVTRNLSEELAGIITGLMLGISYDMPVNVQKVFSNSGTMHLLAVSGLHLGIIAAVVFFLVRLFIPKRTPGLIILAVTVFLYALLIGERASIMRAALMAEIGILVWLLDRDRNHWNTVSITALILFIINPFYIFQISFQLSFAAVIGILAFNSFFQKIFKFMPSIIRDLVAVSFSAQLPVIPFVLFYFHKMVFSSVFANVLAVPFSGLAIILGFFSVFAGALKLWFLNNWINTLNSFVLKIILIWNGFFAKFLYLKSEETSIFVLIAIFFALAAFFVALSNFKFKKFSILLLTASIIFFGVFLFSPKWSVKTIFLNAGNSADLVVVRLNKGNDILFFNADASKVEKILRPFMMIRSIEKFSHIFLLDDSVKVLDGLNYLLEKESLSETKIWSGKKQKDFLLYPSKGLIWKTNDFSVSLSEKNLFVLTLGTNKIVIQPQNNIKNLNSIERCSVFYKGRSSFFYDENIEEIDMLEKRFKPETTFILKLNPSFRFALKKHLIDLLKTREIDVTFYNNKEFLIKAVNW